MPTVSILIARNPPPGDAQNSRSPNLLQPNKDTTNFPVLKIGMGPYSAEANSVNGSFGHPPPGDFLRSFPYWHRDRRFVVQLRRYCRMAAAGRQ
jgi:hypothetical protein